MMELLGKLTGRTASGDLAPIDYGRVFCSSPVWLMMDILVFSFLTEYLRPDDIERFMEYSELLLQREERLFIFRIRVMNFFSLRRRIDPEKGLICYHLVWMSMKKKTVYSSFWYGKAL